jgi:hypothetical protein
MATRFIFGPESAQFPSTNFPELKIVHTTERRMVLGFDASTEETCMWEAVVPQGWTGTPTAIVFYSMASATGAVGVAVGVSVEAIASGEATDLDAATSYDTENVATDTAVPGTAGFMESISITLTTHDTSVAGELVRFKLARKVANAADTATGDMHVHRVEVRDAA